MCCYKGFIPQSSPSHLIHQEDDYGVAISQFKQKMLSGCRCITSFFTFAPTHQLYTGLGACKKEKIKKKKNKKKKQTTNQLRLWKFAEQNKIKLWG